MGAFNGFHLIGTAKTDLYTPFPNSRAPQQCFLLEVPNGLNSPFVFAVFLNPTSRFPDFSAIKGRRVAVSGMLRSSLSASKARLPIATVVAYDIYPIAETVRKRAGEYE